MNNDIASASSQTILTMGKTVSLFDQFFLKSIPKLATFLSELNFSELFDFSLLKSFLQTLSESFIKLTKYFGGLSDQLSHISSDTSNQASWHQLYENKKNQSTALTTQKESKSATTSIFNSFFKKKKSTRHRNKITENQPAGNNKLSYFGSIAKKMNPVNSLINLDGINQLQILGSLFDRLKFSVLSIGLSFTDRLMPYLDKIITAFDSWIVTNSEVIGQWIDQLVSMLPDAANLVNVVGDSILNIASAIGSVLNSIGGVKTVLIALIGIKVISFISALVAGFQSLSFIIPVVTGVFRMLGVAFAANPIGFVITAMALGAALIIKYWQPILGFFQQLWGGIKSVFSVVMNWLKPYFTWISQFFSMISKSVSWLLKFLGFSTDEKEDNKSKKNEKDKTNKKQTTSFNTLNKTQLNSMNEAEVKLKPKLNLISDHESKIKQIPTPMNKIEDEIQSVKNSNQYHTNDLSSSNEQNKNTSISVTNHITVASNQDNNLEDITQAAQSGTDKALSFYDIHGGY